VGYGERIRISKVFYENLARSMRITDLAATVRLSHVEITQDMLLRMDKSLAQIALESTVY
jgi:hypothetical protein